ALRKEKVDEKILSLIGFKVTKINGLFLGNFLGVKFAENLSDVKKYIKTNNLVVCGALKFNPNSTTDSTSSKVARAINADVFVNITNVKGLFNKDPKLKGAKFIPEISFKDFKKKANKLKYKAGQHFVLDQRSSKIIGKYKIKTVIIKDIENLVKIINGEKFIGTTIS
ncbi:MAG: hypothetical protein KKG75_04835, partial [Nanoarchaeota archaeon]|nr:hypothetical protein [Nanoarchaeota archaeon]